MKDRVTQCLAMIEEMTGAKRFFLCMACGILSAFAFPPFNFWPVAGFCFPCLFFFLKGAKSRWGSFGLGWAFAFGQLTINLYWIAGALFVDIKTFWWVLPVAVAGLPALLALDYAVAALAVRRWRAKARGAIALALAWGAADFVRGFLFTGFPWDVTGYVWADHLAVMQMVSVIGVDGLGLVTLVLFMLPAVALLSPKRRARATLGLGAVVLGCMWGWGAWRLGQASDRVVEGARVRLVQPAISQYDKWKHANREELYQRLIDLSFAKAELPLTAIVWPETAAPFYLGEDVSRRLVLGALLGEQTKLLTGVVQRAANEQNPAKIDYFNSLIAIDGSAHVVAGYDKFHLVPFGEYIPFRALLPTTAAAVGMDFSAGDGPHTLTLKGLPPFSPLVCYEAIFSGEVAETEVRPALLVNVTNDGWYEGTTGPAQHFVLARARAIEEGVPMLRASNKGVTAIVDGYGRIRAMVGGERPAFVDGDVPVTTSDRTLFSMYGRNASVALFLLCCISGAFWGVWKKLIMFVSRKQTK